MKVVARSIEGYDTVYFPVWSEVNGQDDIAWYPAEKQADGSWAYTVNLPNHNSVGSYLIHVYGAKNGKMEMLTNTTAYVEKLAARVTATVSADCRTMQLVVTNIGEYEQVYLPTWSAVNGQDDIVWYPAVKQADGTWTYTVDLSNHNSTGNYMIHVYGKRDGKQELITGTTAYVEKLPPRVTAEVPGGLPHHAARRGEYRRLRPGVSGHMERERMVRMTLSGIPPKNKRTELGRIRWTCGSTTPRDST